jgi:uncharacterized protein (TIGR03084 family)
MADLSALLADLADEGAELDTLVSTVDVSALDTPTPAPGWTVRHQIGHLAWTDRVAILAVGNPEAFAATLTDAIQSGGDFVNHAAHQAASEPIDDLLPSWRAGRIELVEMLRAVPAGERIAWFGPPMSVASMATARLMETWAHGLDIADALGVPVKPTARIRHIAHLGTRTVGFAFTLHGLPVPAEPFRFELTGPDGDLWTWGPADATDRISGPALDFCYLVTQRRHPDDLALDVVGEHARKWMPIAQAFAGPPGEGRLPS